MRKLFLIGLFLLGVVGGVNAYEEECFDRAVEVLEEEDPDCEKPHSEQTDILNRVYAECWLEKRG